MRTFALGRYALSIGAAGAFLAGCGGHTPITASRAMPYAYAQQRQTLPIAEARRPVKTKIQHVIVVIQENRSFNNLFYGYPGARTVTYGYNHKNQKIVLQPVGLETKWDLEHDSNGFFLSCNGVGSIRGTKCRMNGFDQEAWSCNMPGYPRCPNNNPPYSYVPQVEVQPYFDMAKQYVLADEFFASNFDTNSFIAHQYMIAGVNPESTVDHPTSVWGCPGGAPDKINKLLPYRQIPGNTISPCWDVPTLADELDKAGLSWAYYAVKVKSIGSFRNCGSGLGPDNASKGWTGIWSAFQAIKHICYGSDWNNVFSPSSQFLVDIKYGKLRSVTWITPTYANSDHGGSGSKTGPSWVTAIVNSVGKSKYWNSTAIFVLWDDSGGWYDPVPPAFKDWDGLGFRPPLLIISPYAMKGLVSHVHFEFGSILKFAEDQFGLGRLAASDTRATSPARYCFDFNQPPRKFIPIKAPLDESYFRAEPLDERVPDDR